MSYSGQEWEQLNAQINSDSCSLYVRNETADTITEWGGAGLNSSQQSVLLPIFYINEEDYGYGTTPTIKLTSSSSSPYAYLGVSSVDNGIIVNNQYAGYKFGSAQSNGLITSYTQSITMDVPDNLIEDETRGITFGNTNIPFYAIGFYRTKLRKYNTGSYLT